MAIEIKGVGINTGGRPSPSRQLGKKTSFNLKKGAFEKHAGVSDIVENQDAANELLAGILSAIQNLGGEPSDGFFSLFGKKDKEGDKGGMDIGSMFKDSFFEKFGGKLEKSPFGQKIFGKLGSLVSSSGASSAASGSIAKGAGAGGTIMMILQIINKVLEALRTALGMINDTIEKGIEQNIAIQRQYLGPVSARLQNFSSDSAAAFKDLSYNVRNIFTNSRYINQQKLIENIGHLVQEGVGYNLEDRAYLATIADRTVATFEILQNSNLNRMIRLQQADLTRQQFGVESYLTQFLNEYYKDTSYLSDMYDSVLAGLMDAVSQLEYDETTGFLFNVQKWMSALYSVGMSDSAINAIVQGINYLGSGNVNQLSGNTQLNTLLAMSAQRSGLGYSNLLTYGLSDKNVDKLLNSMVDYLRSIANNTNNEVLKSEYGRVFGGLSVSDIRALQNLRDEDLLKLRTTTLDYVAAETEAKSQIENVKDRTPVAEQIENMYNNLVYSIGAQIGESESSYMKWYWANFSEEVGDLVGGILPGIVGDLVSNMVGFVTEAIKTDEVLNTIRGKNKEVKGLDLFTNIATKTIDNMEDAAFSWQDDWGGWGTLVNILSGLWTLKSAFNAVSSGVSIEGAKMLWEPFSQRGATDPYSFATNFVGEEYAVEMSRAHQYSSSISLGDNVFAKNEAKVKIEDIVSIDEAVTKSVDELYQGLFGQSSRPIKVVVTDLDGKVLENQIINQPSTDFETIDSLIASGKYRTPEERMKDVIHQRSQK